MNVNDVSAHTKRIITKETLSKWCKNRSSFSVRSLSRKYFSVDEKLLNFLCNFITTRIQLGAHKIIAYDTIHWSESNAIHSMSKEKSMILY